MLGFDRMLSTGRPLMTELPEDAGGLGHRALTSEQVIADDADLQAGIGAVAGLVAGSLGLPELLAEVAGFAVQAIPGADGAGVTLLRVDRMDNMVEALAASAAFVAEIDEIQYVTLKEGPCITAALERRTVRSGSLGGEKMWPRFGPRVGRLGVHSALSLPLLLRRIRWSGRSMFTPTTKMSSMSTPSNWGNCSPNPQRSRCTTPRSSRRR